MKFTTSFEGIEKNSQADTLVPGLYNVTIKSIKENKAKSGAYGLNIVTEATEAEGENVGKVAFGTLWIKKAGKNELSDYGKQRIMEVMDALSIDCDPIAQFEFDTDDWKGETVFIEVGVEKSSGLNADGEPYPDRTQIKKFLTDEEYEDAIAKKSQIQTTTAAAEGEDILDTEEEVKKPAKKVAKKAVKKELPVEEEEITFEDDEEEVVEAKPAKKVVKKKAAKKVAAPVVEEVVETTEETEDEFDEDDLDGLFEDIK